MGCRHRRAGAALRVAAAAGLAGSGKLLSVEGGSTADGAKIVQLIDSGAGTQRWRLASSGGFTGTGNGGSGKVLDVPGGATTARTPQIQRVLNNGANHHRTLPTSV